MTFAFLLASVTVGRLVRLIVDDSILDKPRLWWELNLKDIWVKLLGCPWCISAWLAVPVTAITALALHRWIVLAWWPAIWWGGCCSYWVTQALARYATED